MTVGSNRDGTDNNNNNKYINNSFDNDNHFDNNNGNFNDNYDYARPHKLLSCWNKGNLFIYLPIYLLWYK